MPPAASARRSPRRCIEQGATVAISGTRAAVLEELKAELGERVHVLTCNLADAADVEKLVPAAEAAMGSLDILVNNAGIARTGWPCA